MKETYFEVILSSRFRISPENAIETGNRLVANSRERLVAVTERKGNLVFIIGPREELDQHTQFKQ